MNPSAQFLFQNTQWINSNNRERCETGGEFPASESSQHKLIFFSETELKSLRQTGMNWFKPFSKLTELKFPSTLQGYNQNMKSNLQMMSRLLFTKLGKEKKVLDSGLRISWHHRLKSEKLPGLFVDARMSTPSSLFLHASPASVSTGLWLFIAVNTSRLMISACRVAGSEWFARASFLWFLGDWFGRGRGSSPPLGFLDKSLVREAGTYGWFDILVGGEAPVERLGRLGLSIALRGLVACSRRDFVGRGCLICRHMTGINFFSCNLKKRCEILGI